MVKYTIEYETKAGPGAIIDGTVIADLKGWSTSHSFDFNLPVRNDAHAVQLTKEWYLEVDKDLSRRHRYMVGEPRLLKTVTLDWKN